MTNILIKLSYTNNRLVIKNASFLLEVNVKFFSDLRFSAQFDKKIQLF